MRGVGAFQREDVLKDVGATSREGLAKTILKSERIKYYFNQGRINPIEGPGPPKIWGPQKFGAPSVPYNYQYRKIHRLRNFEHYDRVDRGRDKYVTQRTASNEQSEIATEFIY